MRFIYLFLGFFLLVTCEQNKPGTISNIPSKNLNDSAGHRWKELQVPNSSKAGFTLLSPEQTGIQFQNSLKDEQMTQNQILQSGSGVATGDIDGDGLVDIYLCRLDGNNALYKNLGNWKFKDIAEEAGVACPNQFSTGACFADIDGDGDLDLLVTNLGNLNNLFINNGQGKFTLSQNSGLNTNRGSMSVAFADVDSDGDLDLYITNYRTTTFKDFGAEISLGLTEDGLFIIPPHLKERIEFDGEVRIPKEDLPKFKDEQGKFSIPADYQKKLSFNQKIREYGEVDVLYLNDGKGNFSPLSFLSGAFLDENGKKLEHPPRDWGLAVMFKDMNDDLLPDIYVCNDFWTPDRIWINQGNGSFREIDPLAIRSISATSMGVDFSDINRDGYDDFFVVDMMARDHKRRKMQMGAMQPTPIEIGLIDNRPQIMRNTLFLNRGDHTYSEIALYGGVQDTEWSWCPVFFDVDLDGYEDLFVSNGHARDVQDSDTNNRIKAIEFQTMVQKKMAMLMYPRLSTPNLIYKNEGNLHFKDMGKQWGITQELITHGVALADLDNDGDLDLVTNNLYSPTGVYRNEAGAPRIGVRLKGLPPNTQGIGAKITFKGGPVTQTKEILSGGRYLSGSDPYVVFAPGNATQNLTLEVTWRNGRKSIISDVKPNRVYEIDENTSKKVEVQPKTSPTPTFKDVSERINHTHIEEGFDDFAYQSLLPNRFSQLGPAVSAYDVNGDGDDDLLIGSGVTGKLAVYLNNQKGGFQAMPSDLFPVTKRDQTAIVAYRGKEGTANVLVGLSNFEDAKAEGAGVEQYQFQSQPSRQEVVPAQLSSTGPVSLADINGDGYLDLFVGDRTIPKYYPKPASSRIFLGSANGKFVLDEENTAKLKEVGLVSASVFSDLNSDGSPDLILALEWGPVMVFLNDNGKLTNATEQLKLSEYLGWWNGVTTGDIDGDGRLDIIATNWGLNSKYHYSKEHPLLVYFNDFDSDGVFDIIEAHYDHRMHALVPERGLSCSSRAMPFIRETINTYEKYGGSTLLDIYGDRLKTAPMLEVNDLTHKIFFNRGSHFEAVALPTEAQLTPGFGVLVADYDGDGAEDIFMTQNFFASQIETPRIDAGRGLWLKGNGKGGVTPVPGQNSGIKVYGDARGACISDFNGDGRIDICVTQNGALTKLYENTQAKPGLRVRLQGAEHNPDAIGAQCRLVGENYKGPLRELQAGSGYWSQNSLVQVLTSPTLLKPQLWVKWPGGKEMTVDIPSQAKEITVSFDGQVQVNR